VFIASFGFVDEEVGCFEAGAEADVALTAEKGFVTPGFGELHVGVHILIFGANEGLFDGVGVGVVVIVVVAGAGTGSRWGLEVVD